MTIAEALITSEKALAHEDNPRLHARMLVAAALQTSISQLYILDNSQQLDSKTQKSFQDMLARSGTEEPFDYILGYRMFRGLRINITKDVLIPRPETEELVQLVLDSSLLSNNSRVLEVGIGSGCIGVTLLDGATKLGLESIHFTGIDKSAAALEVACDNYTHLLHAEFSKATQPLSYADSVSNIQLLNITAAELVKTQLPHPDILIANPPYGTDAEMADLPVSVKDYEPLMAISGGNDGLDVYRDIATYAGSLHSRPAVFLEISPAIADAVAQLFRDIYANVEVKPDLFGRIRFLIATT